MAETLRQPEEGEGNEQETQGIVDMWVEMKMAEYDNDTDKVEEERKSLLEEYGGNNDEYIGHIRADLENNPRYAPRLAEYDTTRSELNKEIGNRYAKQRKESDPEIPNRG